MWVLLPNPMNVFFQESDGMKKARATIAWLLSLLIFLESSIPYYFTRMHVRMYARVAWSGFNRRVVGASSTRRWRLIDTSIELNRRVDETMLTCALSNITLRIPSFHL